MTTASEHRSTCVLVVDDEADVLQIAKLTCGDQCRLFTAADGNEALAVVEREPVVVLVTDHRMPGMTGLELIRAARLPATLADSLDPWVRDEFLALWNAVAQGDANDPY